MTYRLLIKTAGKWQEVGLRHASAYSARDEARELWAGLPYLVLPTAQ